MKILVLCGLLLGPLAVNAAGPEAGQTDAPEPRLYDHYHLLKRMQESLAGHSPEEQIRLQPQIKGAERMACERLRNERQEGVPKEDYRREGGDEFLVFALQFEQYCETIR